MTENAARKRKENTEKRHLMLIDKFNETYSQRFEGMKLSLDDVIKKVANDFGYSERTVKNILKA